MERIDELAILREQIQVMKENVHELGANYDRMVNRMFALLGAELALAGLLTSELVSIPYPTTTAGLIFFYLAITCMILSVGLLLFNYRTIRNWPTPMGEGEIKLMNRSSNDLEALRILFHDYEATYDQRNAIIQPKARSVNVSLLLFIIGFILLLVLRFGG